MDPSKKRKGKETVEDIIGKTARQRRRQDQTPSSIVDAGNNHPSAPINDPSLTESSKLRKAAQDSSKFNPVSSKLPVIRHQYDITFHVRTQEEFREVVQKTTGRNSGQLANRGKGQTSHQGFPESLNSAQPQQASNTRHPFQQPSDHYNQILKNTLPMQANSTIPSPSPNCRPPYIQVTEAASALGGLLVHHQPPPPPPPSLSFDNAMDIINKFVNQVFEDASNLNEFSFWKLEIDLRLPPGTDLFQLYLSHKSLPVVINSLKTYFQSSLNWRPLEVGQIRNSNKLPTTHQGLPESLTSGKSLAHLPDFGFSDNFVDPQMVWNGSDGNTNLVVSGPFQFPQTTHSHPTGAFNIRGMADSSNAGYMDDIRKDYRWKPVAQNPQGSFHMVGAFPHNQLPQNTNQGCPQSPLLIHHYQQSTSISYHLPYQVPPAAAAEFQLLPPPSLSFTNAREKLSAFVAGAGPNGSHLNREFFMHLQRFLGLPEWTCLFELYQRHGNSLQEVIMYVLNYFYFWETCLNP